MQRDTDGQGVRVPRQGDVIRLVGMRFFGYHGVLDAERVLGQRFEVDVAMSLDLGPAGRHDDVARTVDYGAVFEGVRAIVEGPPSALIEAVAERIAAWVLGEFAPVDSLVVRVRKPEAPVRGILSTAEVEIARTRVDTVEQ